MLKRPLSPPMEILWNLLLITLGSILCAVAINGILVPRQFLAGGFTGLSLLLHCLLPALPVGAAYFIFNSREGRAIADEIMNRMNRGVTVVQGEGGYSGQPMRILYSVITFPELSRFKNLVHQKDPDAFVVITETLEVMGKGIGNQPHW